MGHNRWTTGQEIMDKYQLQPFELMAIMAAKAIGVNQFGQGVGSTSILINNKAILGSVDQNTIEESSKYDLGQAVIYLSIIENKERKSKEQEVRFYSDESTDEFFKTRDKKRALYYAMTPSRYKNELGINEPLFFSDIPLFLFSTEDVETIEYLLMAEGVLITDIEGPQLHRGAALAPDASIMTPESEVPAYDPATADHSAKVREAARLEIENKKLPKERRLKQAEMAKKVLGTGYGHQDPTRQYRALRDEAVRDGLIPE